MPLNDTPIRGLKAEARAGKYVGGLFLPIPGSGEGTGDICQDERAVPCFR